MTPYSDATRLGAVLESDIDLCEQMDRLLDAERSALEGARVDVLEGVAREKIRLRDRLADNASRRGALVEGIASAFGLSRDAGLGTILRRLPRHEEERLRSISNRLAGRLQAIRRASARNERLIGHSLRHVRASMGFLQLRLKNELRPDGPRVISREA